MIGIVILFLTLELLWFLSLDFTEKYFYEFDLNDNA